VWWCRPVILALLKLRQEDGELEASLGYIVIPYLKKPKPKPKQTNKQKTETIQLCREIRQINIFFFGSTIV
jgi:hypothetical protein